MFLIGLLFLYSWPISISFLEYRKPSGSFHINYWNVPYWFLGSHLRSTFIQTWRSWLYGYLISPFCKLNHSSYSYRSSDSNHFKLMILLHVWHFDGSSFRHLIWFVYCGHYKYRSHWRSFDGIFCLSAGDGSSPQVPVYMIGFPIGNLVTHLLHYQNSFTLIIQEIVLVAFHGSNRRVVNIS